MDRRTGSDIWGDAPQRPHPLWRDRGRGAVTAEQVRADMARLYGDLYRAGLLEATQTVITQRGPEEIQLVRI